MRAMKYVYRWLLRLYPAEYQAAFAAEMRETFIQASEEKERRGKLSTIRFMLTEVGGAAAGLAREWAARAASQNAYITLPSLPEEELDLAPEVRDAHRQLALVIGHMQHAIAHHDFPKARLYSDQERTLRARLAVAAENGI